MGLACFAVWEARSASPGSHRLDLFPREGSGVLGGNELPPGRHQWLHLWCGRGKQAGSDVQRLLPLQELHRWVCFQAWLHRRESRRWRCSIPEQKWAGRTAECSARFLGGLDASWISETCQKAEQSVPHELCKGSQQVANGARFTWPRCVVSSAVVLATWCFGTKSGSSWCLLSPLPYTLFSPTACQGKEATMVYLFVFQPCFKACLCLLGTEERTKRTMSLQRLSRCLSALGFPYG